MVIFPQFWGEILIYHKAGFDKLSIGRHAWKPESFHQSVHSSDADAYAIITLKDVSNFIGTKTFSVVNVNLKNQHGDLLIYFGAISRLGMVMLVISASVNAENSAKSFDIVLQTQLMNGI